MTSRRPATGRHRAEVRPRYGRIALLVTAAVVTLVAVLGGFGLLPSADSPQLAAAAEHALQSTPSAAAGSAEGGAAAAPDPSTAPQDTAPREDATAPRELTSPELRGSTARRTDAALPDHSGTGRRIVFSEDAQRVWLVGRSGEVERTYLVSGSVEDNLDPGTYQVYSRSRWAVGVDDSGTMQYFVRFTQGPTGAAIGFHTIPQKDGQPLQTRAQLGTPRSHGCIRQYRPDAIALWHFAPIGTKVVVTA